MEISKSKISLFSSLDKKKFREKNGLFIAEGHKSVVDLLQFFKPAAIVATKDWFSANPDFEKRYPDLCLSATPEIIKKISSLSTPADVLAVMHIPEAATPEADEYGLNLMLDGIQDPGNLGTIIRTAHWFGIKKIFASRDTVDIYNPKTIQSTMGSLGKVDIIYCDLVEIINRYKDMPVYGTLLEGKSIYQTKLEEKGFIIMGNEGKGISLPLREKITHPLLIPPYNPSDHSESLNVAIATAVTIALFRKQQY